MDMTPPSDSSSFLLHLSDFTRRPHGAPNTTQCPQNEPTVHAERAWQGNVGEDAHLRRCRRFSEAVRFLASSGRS
jgi:hypothetical protein